MFGPHLTIDAYGCDQEKLKDEKIIYDFMDGLPEKIGMTKIMPPMMTVCMEDTVKVKEDTGITCVVLIMESHITLHTFNKKGFATFDLYSCNDFDVDQVLSIFKEMFSPESVEVNLTERGTHFLKTL